MDFKELYAADLARYHVNGKCSASLWLQSFHFFLRKSQSAKMPFLRFIYRLFFRLVKKKRAIEISCFVKIGKGLYLGHPYGITINADTVIGENCNIHRGVLLGQENRGKRRGTPVIGDNVWIGINACVVGNIHIGNDVLIAPNSFVNCDVPDHSIVFGNPCVIKHRDHATQSYINDVIE